jgi:Prolyl oligopeptidase family
MCHIGAQHMRSPICSAGRCRSCSLAWSHRLSISGLVGCARSLSPPRRARTRCQTSRPSLSSCRATRRAIGSRGRTQGHAGLIAGMPFVDVLNTMLDETLPLTPPEWPEWGDPNRDAAAFRTILAYSPYENVRVQTYPAILALAGLTDPRVLSGNQRNGSRGCGACARTTTSLPFAPTSTPVTPAPRAALTVSGKWRSPMPSRSRSLAQYLAEDKQNPCFFLPPRTATGSTSARLRVPGDARDARSCGPSANAITAALARVPLID